MYKCFLRIATVLILYFLPAINITAQNYVNESGGSHVKPSKLNPGDKVGLVAPAFLISQEGLDRAVERIEQLGFVPVPGEHIAGQYGYFSGTDRERAGDFNNMFRNPEIKAVIMTNGGYGCTRILDLLDYDIIKANPKIIMGFSDCTALLNVIHERTGLVTFHGPVAGGIREGYNRLQFENVAVNPSDRYTIENSDADLNRSADDKTFERYTITAGKAEGVLAGGNLTMICSLLGTPYQVDLTGKILLLEDIREEPYRMDRMLTQLIDSGELSKVAGIAFGICRGCDKSDNSTAANSFTLREVIEDRIKPLNIPAVYGLSFGHNDNNFTFPIGVRAELDADTMVITLLEKAVK